MNMSISNLKFLCLIVGLVSYTSPAYAYLDPGTGSMLLTGLIAGLAAIISFLSIYWQKVKAFFVKQEPDTDIDIENKDWLLSMSIHKNSGTFLDPFGCVFHKNDNVFRSILTPAKKQYEATQYKGLIQETIDQGFLIEFSRMY